MGKSLENIDVNRWLKLSKRADVRKTIDKAPDKAFKPIFENLRPREGEDVDWPNLLTAIHVVYGWMPTMLWKNGSPLTANKYPWHWRQRRLNELNRLLTDHKDDVPNAPDIERLIALTNNSTVGLSKVLYLFDPMHFPIWDSRVAKNFLLPTGDRQVGNNVGWYLTWLTTAREWARTASVKKRVSELRRKHSSLTGLSTLRIVEIVLFGARP